MDDGCVSWLGRHGSSLLRFGFYTLLPVKTTRRFSLWLSALPIRHQCGLFPGRSVR